MIEKAYPSYWSLITYGEGLFEFEGGATIQ